MLFCLYINWNHLCVCRKPAILCHPGLSKRNKRSKAYVWTNLTIRYFKPHPYLDIQPLWRWSLPTTQEKRWKQNCKSWEGFDVPDEKQMFNKNRNLSFSQIYIRWLCMRSDRKATCSEVFNSKRTFQTWLRTLPALEREELFVNKMKNEILQFIPWMHSLMHIRLYQECFASPGKTTCITCHLLLFCMMIVYKIKSLSFNKKKPFKIIQDKTISPGEDNLYHLTRAALFAAS